MPSPDGAPRDAQCALHPDQPASRVCARCGNFMCHDCSGGGAESWCPSCRALGGPSEFPYARGDISFNALFGYAYDVFKRDWLMVSLAGLVFFGVSFAASGVTSALNQMALGLSGVDPRDSGSALTALAIAMGMALTVGMAVNMVVQGFVVLGLYRVLIDALDGHKVDLGRMFSQGRKLGRYITLNLLLLGLTLAPLVVLFGAAVGLVFLTSGLSAEAVDAESLGRAMSPAAVGVILLGLVAFLAYSVVLLPLWLFGVPELVVSDASATEALRRAWQLSGGLRLTVFGYSLVSGLVVAAGFVACCVGVVPAMGLAYLLNLALFLAARNEPSLELPART